MLKNNLKSNFGFTLVETLVALSVFAIASVIISGIFINASNLQQHTASFQRLQNEARYMMEKMAREIRAREIDYSQIALDANNMTAQLVFKKDEANKVVGLNRLGADLLYIEIDGGTVSAPLNANDVEVVSVWFRIYPGKDPFLINSATNSYYNNIQPRVTILLKIKNRTGKVAEKYQEELSVQTAISSKSYQR